MIGSSLSVCSRAPRCCLTRAMQDARKSDFHVESRGEAPEEEREEPLPVRCEVVLPPLPFCCCCCVSRPGVCQRFAFATKPTERLLAEEETEETPPGDLPLGGGAGAGDEKRGAAALAIVNDDMARAEVIGATRGGK
jgi:hypothetical protein